MSGIFVAVSFHSINDVVSTITILLIGNYLSHLYENLQTLDM